MATHFGEGNQTGKYQHPTLVFLPGEIPMDKAWGEAAVHAFAKSLSDFHDNKFSSLTFC